jgi:hypothetical protein
MSRTARKPKLCTYCDNALDHEERVHPRKDEAGAVMCDGCFHEHYEDNCSRCEECVEKADLKAAPGELIGIWREAPSEYGPDLQPGYYRVLRWPIFADFMIHGHLYSRHLKFVAPLDSKGEVAADHCHSVAGPMCPDCREAAELLIPRDDGLSMNNG